ncbi:EAL domain-containing protein [Martelella mediterranea]|uniref:bifunctional diguanylate cyclase/phosphodiesterase n=1 Tax=Martelella mediterranea TaxID=293089 RepID=UPI001E63CD1B|nr:EAL domain-containing protein [Martelella mediterranea]MCD1633818.1 EAL domain-containing protein [Martelella mediterranea]
MVEPAKTPGARRWGIIPSDILALSATALVLASMYFTNRALDSDFTHNLRLQTAEKVALSSTRVTAGIRENLTLAEGLGLAISLEPEISPRRFEDLATKLLAQDSALVSLALARDMTIEMVYPFTENREAIGLNYADRPDQMAAIEKALLTREPVIDGPIPLVQGGNALVAYYPLYDGPENEAWGIFTAIINVDRLLSGKTLAALHPDLIMAIRKDADDDAPAQVLSGGDAIFAGDPVTQTVALANTNWTVAAIPRQGWKEPLRQRISRHLLVDSIGILIIAFMLGIAKLMRERNRNITMLRAREAELQHLSQRMQFALEASRIGVWDMDAETGEAIWDERMYALYGERPDCDKNGVEIWSRRLHPEDRQLELERLEHFLAEQQNFRSDFRIVLDDGSVRHLQVFGGFYNDIDGRTHVVGVNWDITEDIRLHEDIKRANAETLEKNRELERAQAVLRHNALHDGLTELPNRSYLEAAFVKGDEKAGVGPPYAVLHIDLDRFKEINDTLGHSAGDAMLRHAANMLRSIAAPRDFLARVGGDEFTLVTHWDGDAERLSRLAQNIIRALGKPLQYGEHQVRVSASVGIAWMDDEASSMREVLVNGGIALYEAKRMGRNQAVVFDAALRNIAITNKKVADELLVALENDQFQVFYQPQISAHTLEIEGAEALVRWRHPERGMLAPGHFIPTAETTGSIARIDAVVLNKAAAQHRAWCEMGIAVPHVSVNISAQRLVDPGLLDSIREIAPKPGSLCLELLESISFDEQGTSLETSVAQIKALGVDVEIDDFGTGYASILSLLALEPKRLKIDRQLVFPITTGQSQRRLVASIVEIGQALGIEVIAEGVETLEHARILRDLGVDAFQGFFFAPPLDNEAFQRFARERRWVEQFDVNADPPVAD